MIHWKTYYIAKRNGHIKYLRRAGRILEVYDVTCTNPHWGRVTEPKRWFTRWIPDAYNEITYDDLMLEML